MRAAIRSRRSASANAPQLTSRELLARAARLLLWLAVLIVVLRGLDGIVTARRPVSRPGTASDAQTAALAWRDDAARALAVQFAIAYLTHAAGEDPGAYVRRVEAFASAELAGQLAPVFDRRAPAQGRAGGHGRRRGAP